MSKAGGIASVSGVYDKVSRGAPMVQVSHMDAVLGGSEPRQVNLALAESLRAHGVKPAGARSQLIVDGAAGQVESGDVLAIGGARIRITFACEPCAHGAQLAGVPMRAFRQIQRYLGIVVSPGRVAEGDPVEVEAGVFERAPADFRGRAAWAVERIPPGRAVTSLAFLVAIGASRSYLRALPRWLAAAREAGRPVHRVLTAQMSEPSWAPGALAHLAAEGGSGPVPYPLAAEVWGGPSL
ncbi:hypothetical protein Ssi03_41860 [Sphaerisporangium siamense]|uniref:MOSC domain-containing protein n=1 Tax=Sphaerisporangium siamense TaxID=795645 RepID=A0A7W7DD35_9ACTN|nr:MOSC domain-containing protein [Sphaerisporangium siamense]MBB4704582.1 hypothetical protein [Sphaerisporangium siamense]GII86196.1 hypothetical protein Ssi03_41860 [Sphaerisporangium siamense]